MLRVPAGGLVALTVMMVIAMAFTTPYGAAMLRVPTGDLVVLTVMMVIAMAPIRVAMLRVPAGGLVALTVMMVIAMAFTTPCGAAMLRVPAGGLVALRPVRCRIRSCPFIASMPFPLCSSVYSLLHFFSPFSSTSSPSTALPMSAAAPTAIATPT